MNTNKTYRVLGLMSGTSLDGIDLAICTFNKKENWEFKIHKSKTIKYSNEWKKTLKYLHKKNKKTIIKTNINYAKLLAKKIINFLKNDNVDFIASHGHTIFHEPQKKYTLQIGDGQTIANITNIKTVTNFRALDVFLNGQGAPLVPIGDLHLFNKYKYCVNLGGFANISIKEGDKIIAFDICPVNIILNKISEKIGFEFDKDGMIAKKGKIIPKLLRELNSLSFYNKKPPKSLSREWVESYITPLIIKNYPIKDTLHTLCEHISIKISDLLSNETALFTGGGVLNTYLLDRISYHSKAKIFIPNKQTINFKEALIFAFLGVLKIRGEINCLKSVTGATQDSCVGEINNPM